MGTSQHFPSEVLQLAKSNIVGSLKPSSGRICLSLSLTSIQTSAPTPQQCSISPAKSGVEAYLFFFISCRTNVSRGTRSRGSKRDKRTTTYQTDTSTPTAHLTLTPPLNRPPHTQQQTRPHPRRSRRYSPSPLPHSHPSIRRRRRRPRRAPSNSPRPSRKTPASTKPRRPAKLRRAARPAKARAAAAGGRQNRYASVTGVCAIMHAYCGPSFVRRRPTHVGAAGGAPGHQSASCTTTTAFRRPASSCATIASVKKQRIYPILVYFGRWEEGGGKKSGVETVRRILIAQTVGADRKRFP